MCVAIKAFCGMSTSPIVPYLYSLKSLHLAHKIIGLIGKIGLEAITSQNIWNSISRVRKTVTISTVKSLAVVISIHVRIALNSEAHDLFGCRSLRKFSFRNEQFHQNEKNMNQCIDFLNFLKPINGGAPGWLS